MLSLVNTFESPYEAWSTRLATVEEMREMQRRNEPMRLYVHDQLQARVNNALEAARYIAQVGTDNGLGRFINSALDQNTSYKSWKEALPQGTPPTLKNYQQQFSTSDFVAVDASINNVGSLLSDGQFLFHAGLWPSNGSSFTTTRPFSATFCPQVALRNVEHKGKAYDNDRIDLFVLRVAKPVTKVFAYRRAGTKMGHENEVLFASGATLTRRSEGKIRDDYVASNANSEKKHISIYVLEVEIS